MKRSDRILIVSYYYPPYVFGGSLRMHYLRKYLEEKGYSVSVITAQPSDEKNTTVINDPFPSSSIKKKNPGLRKYNPMPDSMFIWSIRVSLFIRKHHNEFSSIIISIPPYSASIFPALMIPAYIRKRIILDVRDTWSGGPLAEYQNSLFEVMDRFTECFTYSRFHCFTGVTKGIVDNLAAKTGRHIFYIENPLNRSEAGSGRVGNHLVYTGKIDMVRFNEEFFSAYSQMSEFPDIVFAGSDNRHMLEQYDFVKQKGTMNRKKTLSLIEEAGAGLILLGFNQPRYYEIFPSKLLDYILCRKPVLYVGPPTIASEFIENEGIGIAVTSPEREKIIIGIERILEGEFKVSDALIESLDYHLVFEKYLRLLDTASLNSGGP